MVHAVLHLLIGVDHDSVGRVVGQANGQRHLELTATRFVQEPTTQSRPQHVQLCFAHRSLEPEQEPVIEVAGIVDAILIHDQRIAQRADLQESVPVAVVAGESRDLQS
jgi:hypothetical protein